MQWIKCNIWALYIYCYVCIYHYTYNINTAALNLLFIFVLIFIYWPIKCNRQILKIYTIYFRVFVYFPASFVFNLSLYTMSVIQFYVTFSVRNRAKYTKINFRICSWQKIVSYSITGFIKLVNCLKFVLSR
jgi:hypothetical protein